MYCDWKGYIFNPQKYDTTTGKPFQIDKDGRPVIDDKAGGVEYFTVGTSPSGTAPDGENIYNDYTERKLEF